MVPFDATVRELNRLRKSILQMYVTPQGQNRLSRLSGGTADPESIPEAADSIANAIRLLGGYVLDVEGY